MAKIVKLNIKEKEIPVPIEINGRERAMRGWSTAGVSKWLLTKKEQEKYTTPAECASVWYFRDSERTRARVRSNVHHIRSWLDDHNEFLLVKYTDDRRIAGFKVCDPQNPNDRQVAKERLQELEAKGEINEAQRRKWEEMLFLPKKD